MQVGKFILVRVAIGALISLIGLVVGALAHNLNIYYNGFGIFGLILTLIGAFLFMDGSLRGDLAEHSFGGTDMTELSERKYSFGSTLRVTLLIIGTTNLAFPIVLYFFLH